MQQRSRNPIPRSVTLVAAGVLCVTACASGPDGTPAPQQSTPTDTIRSTVDIPSTFNPALGLARPDYQLARLSFDTLLRKDDSGLIGGLAASWEETPTEVIFTLRGDVSCDDGTVITPTVVKDSIDYFANAGGSAVPMTFGRQAPTVTADDAAGTVSVAVAEPWPYLATAFTVTATGIICPAGLADPDTLGSGIVPGAYSGPYVPVSADPGVRYRYQLRDDYTAWPEWADVPGIPAKHFEYVVTSASDITATANLVLDRQLDIAKIMPDQIPRFEGNDDYTIAAFPFSDYYLIFNERAGSPFTDPAARKAVVQAIDLDTFLDITWQGYGEIATDFASSRTPCVTGDTSTMIQPDPTAAAEVLQGVKMRIVGPLVVGTNGSGNTYIQEVLRAAGAEVELQNVDVGTWISAVWAEPSSWDVAVYPDFNFLGSLSGVVGNFQGPEPADGGSNLGGIQDETVAQALQDARVAPDQATRCEALSRATDRIKSEAHGAPLITDNYIYVLRPGFQVRMPGGTLDDDQFRIIR